jgi:Spy/CpxP family protein refolding chaperone
MRLLATTLAFGACVLGLVAALPSNAQGPAASKPAPRAAEQGDRWSDLKPGQQAALKPLEREWSGIDGRSKRKWLELSARFPKLTPAEQARVQERMSDWTKLTPKERGEARMHFQEAKQVPAEDRQARWKAYEALTPEQKRQLAARAAPANEPARKGGAPGARNDSKSDKLDKAARDTAPQAKSNIVPNPAFASPPRAVAPTIVQARPGATTTLITKRPTPPRHQQTGMPKIAATPEFVNQATLLPQRGPQGAATRSAAAPGIASGGASAPARE